jgi:RNA polymerase sigma-70 factor (ECF subfamily)
MYKAPVYTYLVRCGVAESHRDDLFQEAFLAIHRGAGRFDQSYPLNPWLFRIVANTVRSFFRKERVRSFITPGEIHVALIAHERTEHSVEAKETARWIEARIAALPLKQREVLALTISTSMEQAEIATSLGIPVNSVKTLLRRARMSLANDQKRRSAIQLREIS